MNDSRYPHLKGFLQAHAQAVETALEQRDWRRGICVEVIKLADRNKYEVATIELLEAELDDVLSAWPESDGETTFPIRVEGHSRMAAYKIAEGHRSSYTNATPEECERVTREVVAKRKELWAFIKQEVLEDFYE